MDKYSKRLDATFSALGDPIRRAILGTLSQGGASVSELARPHRISLPAVMKHLRVLEDAGLVSQQKTGRVRHCRLRAQPLMHASDWLSQYQIFWNKQLDALELYLQQDRNLKPSPTEEVNECQPKPKLRRPQRS